MGIFDVFKGQAPQLTPKIALAVSLLYITSADGVIEDEEIGVLLANLHGDKKLLQDAMDYGRLKKFDEFVSAAASLLTDSQKRCILLNLADALLSDGMAASQEKELFDRFLQAWGVAQESIQDELNVIIQKNDHSVLNS
jgi:uncharacterized tellurite resistance protein B-like protein